MSDITLSAGVRSNLLSLQKTADMMSSTQTRLASGKKVNSALDNPNNFFTSQGLSDRAGELSNLLDGIGSATKTIEAADNGIKAITKLVESAQSTVRQAQQNNASTSTTSIQGNASIDTTGASESTAKARAEGMALNNANIGFDADTNFVLTSTTENGVTKTFDLSAHFTATGESLTDNNGTEAGTDAYSVKDLVDDINASGVATASITEDGRLDLQSTGVDELKLELTEATGTGTVQAQGIFDSLGFGASASAGQTGVAYAENGTAADTLTITNKASTGGDADNTELVEQFNEILDQIDELSRDSGFNGINLINGTGSDLTVSFNEHRDSKKSELVIKSADLTSSGLKLSDATSLNSSDSNNQLDKLSEALETLRSQSSTFGSNLNTVKIRQEFTKDSINTLQTGADNLVLADTNEEGANMLALQTRQSLSTTAMSLASQADQAVLRFLRA